jgi:DNA repair photolyase
VFEQEMKTNLAELQKHGLFFSFTTDPMLPETYHLTLHAIGICCNNFIPVKILTKCTEWINDFDDRLKLPQDYKLIAFGFTLTGHDELEPVASTNAERIEAMEKLHNSGFKTFASIEPIIDFDSSYEMILRSQANCDLFKIGLKSGEKYLKHQVIAFVSSVNRQCESVKIYWKDSLLKAAGINRDDLSANCVTRNYNLFK